MIVVCYFLVAGLCAWALRVARLGAKMATNDQDTERRVGGRAAAYRARQLFWGLLVVLFVVLGFGKQFDLHRWMTDVARGIVVSQGWYEQRAPFQAFLVLAAAVAGLAALSVLLRLTRDLLPRQVLALFGLVLLAFFLTVRMSSFHDVDAALEYRIAGLRFSSILELGGIISVGFCAVMNCWWVTFISPKQGLEAGKRALSKAATNLRALGTTGLSRQGPAATYCASVPSQARPEPSKHRSRSGGHVPGDRPPAGSSHRHDQADRESSA